MTIAAHFVLKALDRLSVGRLTLQLPDGKVRSLGNEFYRLWLDPSMTYSAALYEGADAKPLEAAQTDKYERILEQLGAKQGDSILEIGCGWGGFAETAARRGMRVTGVTISQQQL